MSLLKFSGLHKKYVVSVPRFTETQAIASDATHAMRLYSRKLNEVGGSKFAGFSPAENCVTKESIES